MGLPEQVFFTDGTHRFTMDVRTRQTEDFVNACVRQCGIDGGRVRYEAKETAVFLDRIKRKQAAVFFDVGAGVGYYSLLAASCPNVEKVVAFEMLNLFAAEVRFHARNNGLGDEIAVVPLPVGMDGEVVEFENHFDCAEKKAVGLDEYVDEYDLVPDVIKVDVEGFEGRVLEGARQTLEVYGPEILLSLHPRLLKERGGVVGDVVGFLRELYSHVHRIVGGRERGVSREEYVELIDRHLELSFYLDEVGPGEAFVENCTLYCSLESLV